MTDLCRRPILYRSAQVCPSFLMLEWHVRPIHLLFNRHCFILSDCVSRRVTRTGIRRKKIPENAFGACGNDLFVLYLHPQTAPRELSSAGSERLPYKQRVGGSNPSAPTTSAKTTYGNVSRFFVGMLRCRCVAAGPARGLALKHAGLR